MLLEVLLSKSGYKIEMCVNGQEAVDLAEAQKFDVMLMDVQMPIMDGLEATKRIRAGKVNSKTPILAMTASMEKGNEMQCIEAGCDDYIRKPVKKDLALRKIWRFIQQSRQLESAAKGGDIFSFLADDPDYHKTIEMFIDNLPGRLKEMEEALEQGALDELATKVHALKGLGGFAGFPVYSDKARSLEEMIKDNDIETIRLQLDEMINLCRRTKLAKS